MLLIITILLSSQAGLFVFAEESDGNTNDEIFVLGGLRPEMTLQSSAAYVVEIGTGAVVYSKNAHKRVYPASTTKIMTAIVTLENERGDLDRKIEYPAHLDTEFWEGDPNKTGVALSGFAHDQSNLTIRNVLYALMLPSGCEAGNILAHNVGGGDMSKFIDMMNKKAKEIGCKDTNFSNAHGLFEEDNYSTAYDMYLITKYAYDKYNKEFFEFANTTEYRMPSNVNNPEGYDVVNTNRLIRDFPENPYHYAFARGVKTGGFDVYHRKRDANGSWAAENRIDYDGIANLVSTAKRSVERGSYEYMVVTMDAPWHGSPTGYEHWLHNAFNDHKILYDWAFSTFELTEVVRKTDPLTSVTILDGEKDEILLYPQMEDDVFWTLLPKDLDINSAIRHKFNIAETEVPAPIEAGAILGTVEVMLAGQVLGKFDLIADESVERTGAAIAGDRFRELFYREVENENGELEEKLKTEVIVGLVAIAALIIGLIVFAYVRKHRKQRMEKLRANRISRRKSPNKKIRR